MSIKHTPGPWLYDGKSRDVVRNSNGTLVAQLYKIHADTLEADARLIASAPEMLAELKQIQAELLEHGENADAELASRLYRIIAKAEGKE